MTLLRLNGWAQRICGSRCALLALFYGIYISFFSFSTTCSSSASLEFTMAASSSLDDLENTDIIFKTTTIDLSLNQPTSTSESSTSDSPSSLDRPLVPGSPAELLEIEADQVEKKFEIWLRHRIRRTWWLAQWQKIKRTLKRYTPENAISRLGLFLAIFTLALTLYEYIHIKNPTLALGDRATAATEASARAAQYTAYINWLTSVCPTEMVSRVLEHLHHRAAIDFMDSRRAI